MTDQPEAALGLSLKVGLENKELVFQTHIARDSNGAWDDTIDKMMKSADRQIAKEAVVKLKIQWELRKLRLSTMETDFIGLNLREEQQALEWNKNQRRRGPWQRSAIEQKHRDEMVINLAKTRAEIAEYERLHKEAEAAAK
jgi:hypothetical protein